MEGFYQGILEEVIKSTQLRYMLIITPSITQSFEKLKYYCSNNGINFIFKKNNTMQIGFSDISFVSVCHGKGRALESIRGSVYHNIHIHPDIYFTPENLDYILSRKRLKYK